MKWWHVNKFYTGNKEPSFQILIARANAIAFVAMLVSLRSYTVGGREGRRGRGSRSRRGSEDAVSRPAQRLCPMGRQSAAFSRPGPAASLPWVGFLIGGRKRCGWTEDRAHSYLGSASHLRTKRNTSKEIKGTKKEKRTWGSLLQSTCSYCWVNADQWRNPTYRQLCRLGPGLDTLSFLF